MRNLDKSDVFTRILLRHPPPHQKVIVMFPPKNKLDLGQPPAPLFTKIFQFNYFTTSPCPHQWLSFWYKMSKSLKISQIPPFQSIIPTLLIFDFLGNLWHQLLAIHPTIEYNYY